MVSAGPGAQGLSSFSFKLSCASIDNYVFALIAAKGSQATHCWGGRALRSNLDRCTPAKPCRQSLE